MAGQKKGFLRQVASAAVVFGIFFGLLAVAFYAMSGYMEGRLHEEEVLREMSRLGSQSVPVIRTSPAVAPVVEVSDEDYGYTEEGVLEEQYQWVDADAVPEELGRYSPENQPYMECEASGSCRAVNTDKIRTWTREEEAALAQGK